MTEVIITVPDIGDDGGAEVIEILFKAGDLLNPEDIIVVLESDKATMEIPCEHQGTLKSLSVSVGDQVKTGDLIATLLLTNAAAENPKKESESSASKVGENLEIKSVDVAPVLKSASPAQKSETRLVIETVPDTGSEGGSELIEILCKVGARVKKDDILFVLESDKATMEFPATFNGEVTQIFVSLGDKLLFGDKLVEIKTNDTEISKQSSSEISEVVQQPQQVQQVSKQNIQQTQQKQTQQTQTASSYKNANVHAGPAARRLARELGVDLSLVKPSGPKERILKDDIKAFVKANLNKPATSSGFNIDLPIIDFSKFGEVEAQKLSRIKKVSAKNLSRSWLTIPHVTQFDEADITELESFRKQTSADLKEQGVKLTPLAFLVKASASALKEFPRFNSSLDINGENLILKKYFHIGVAVDTEDGLVVPVIKNADSKSLVDIAIELGEISEKARNKKLMPQDMQGACFSISSLGGIGGTAFTPIVNWPEVAILGVSRSQMKPVYDGKEFIPRLMLPLSLSYDHRVIDGAEAARFSRYFSELLADKTLLVL